MNEEKQELRYRQAGVAGSEWSVATTPDEFMQNGVYEIKVINDNGTLNFPYRFAGDDVAKLIVSDSGANGKQQTNRIVVQTITVTPSGTNKSITYTRTRRSVNGNQQWSSWVEPEAASTANIYDGSVTAEKLSEDIRPNVVNPLRPLFIAAGAVYNKNTGYYELNGVDDLTEEEIAKCYAYKEIILNLDKGRIAQNLNIRTIYPYNYTSVAEAFRISGAFYGAWSFYASSLEIFRTSNSITIDDVRKSVVLPCTVLTGTFGVCKNLHSIYPIDVSNCSQISSNVFVSCEKLVELRLWGLKLNLSISDSPLISKDSIIYILNNSAANLAISIVLHTEAYARLANDTDIVTVLEEHPLVSLVSA